MRTILKLMLICILFSCSQKKTDNKKCCNNKSTLPGTAIKNGLFQLNEMDMHVHAGREREVPLNEWIDLSVKDGRKVMLLLDHLELYRMKKEEHSEWLEKNKLNDWYPILSDGHIALMQELEKAKEREDVIIFKGWEIWEGEFEEGLEKEPMKYADVIGWHISKAAWDEAPKGEHIIQRAKQIIEVQNEFPIPMIIYHPFSMRISAIQKMFAESGKDKSSITVNDYRFFKPGEQEKLIALLKGKSVYIEIGRDNAKYWDDPVVRQALIEDIKPLTAGGVQFVVSTDAHVVAHIIKPFNPELYCKDLGITPENTNTIVRELMAIEAIKKLNLEKRSKAEFTNTK
jgi:histidinol phosphatase-like PHP family hydrolase